MNLASEIDIIESAREEGKEEGRKEGKEEGREEGRKNEKRAIAKKMKEDGLSIDSIAQYSSLTKEEIEKV